jgi:hypothetical protein
MDVLSSLRNDLFLKNYREKGGEDSEKYLKFLLTSVVSKRVFLESYKKLPPIEKMPENEKKEMKLYIHSILPGYPVEDKLDACNVHLSHLS